MILRTDLDWQVHRFARHAWSKIASCAQVTQMFVMLEDACKISSFRITPACVPLTVDISLMDRPLQIIAAFAIQLVRRVRALEKTSVSRVLMEK